jgi:hypothetical protein
MYINKIFCHIVAMENKLATAVAMIAIFAAAGTMATSMAVNAFAQSEGSDDEQVPGSLSGLPRSQLEKNCASGNNLACNALEGRGGSLTIHVPGEPPLDTGGVQMANPNNNGPAR